MSGEKYSCAPPLRLPDWLERIVDPQVLQRLRDNKEGLQFSLYEPLFLKNASPATRATPQPHARRQRRRCDDDDDGFGRQSRPVGDSNTYGHDDNDMDEEELAKEQRRARVVASSSDGLFPDLSRMVLSDAFDGVLDVASDDQRAVATELKRRAAALGLNWEQPETLDEIWDGPPLSGKVPPAEDYERLLLDS